MSTRMKIGSWMIVGGCALSFVYGLTAAVMSEDIAGYLFSAAYGGALGALHVNATEFSGSMVLIIGLMGAGLAVCSGVLFWFGLFQRMRPALFAAVIGGGLGLGTLVTVHMNQSAWVLFVVDNICLNLIGIGFGVAGKELLDIVLGREESAEAS